MLMTTLPKRYVAAAALSLAAIGLAACGGGSSTSSGSSGSPVKGGTLNIVAASGPDHLDTVPAYYTADYILERAYTRQLLAYPYAVDNTVSDAGWKKTTTPAADVATEVPSTSNGGITNGGKTYTFHIRSGVKWNSTPARQVTAADFIREFKAFCNPVSPVGNPLYYQSTIAGLTQYCDAETAYFKDPKAHPPTAANIAGFQNSHNISGLTAPNSSTLQFSLIQPASDFLYMLAMPFSSARPVEYDKYVPNSADLNQHMMSDGPYAITSYTPGKSLDMAKNPAWQQSTDPIRHQYVDKVVVTMGVTSAQTQLTGEQAGTYDLVLDTPMEPTAIPGLQAKHDPKFKIWPWSNIFPYTVFNLRSPNSGGAMGKLAVRQAIEYGINKVAVSKVYGGPTLAKPITGAIPPGNVGFATSSTYPTPNNEGDTAKCKSMLASAGYPNGVKLTYLYVNDSVNTQVFTAIQASLKPCGVNVVGKPEPGSSYFVDLGNSPENAKAGTWDLGQPGWIPDWFGNNGRAIIQPLFQTNCVVNTNNYGCYNNTTLNNLIHSAETATSPSTSAADWAQANQIVMKDAVIVPLTDQQGPYYSSSRIQNVGSSAVVYAPNIGGPDITNLWIKG
jgi:peptide/nickel transport system substrate-binding protein